LRVGRCGRRALLVAREGRRAPAAGLRGRRGVTPCVSCRLALVRCEKKATAENAEPAELFKISACLTGCGVALDPLGGLGQLAIPSAEDHADALASDVDFPLERRRRAERACRFDDELQPFPHE